MSRIASQTLGQHSLPVAPPTAERREMTAQEDASGAVWVTGPGSSALCLGLFRELV